MAESPAGGACQRLRSDRADGIAGRAPLWEAFGQPPRLIAVLEEQRQSLIRQQAVGASAVGDDLVIAGQLRQSALEVGQRDRARVQDVALTELLVRAHVDD